MIADAFRSARAATSLTLGGRVAWFFTLMRWQRRVQTERISDSEPVFTVVVLSFARPQNIRPIVRSLLRMPEVKDVIVSNNNPAVDLRPFLTGCGPRVTLLSQAVTRGPDFRLHLARQDGGRYFLFIDDDMFLLPSQLSTVCRGLLADPSVPHGITGQIYDTWLDRMHYSVTDHAGRLDVVSRVTACTDDHVREYFRLSALLGCPAAFADDIILSFAGQGLPQSHRVGRILQCPTSDDARICLWKREGFFPVRMRLFLRVKGLKR